MLCFALGLFRRGQYGCKVDPSAKACGVVWGLLCEEGERKLPFRSPHSQPIHFTAPHRGKMQRFLFHRAASTVLATIPGVTCHYLQRRVSLSILRSMAYHISIEGRTWQPSEATAVAQRNTRAPPLIGTEASRGTRSTEVWVECRVTTSFVCRQGRRRR